jgi:hypothetical protein
MKHKTAIILFCLVVATLGACRPTVDLTPIDSSDGTDGGKTYITMSDSYADIFKAFWQGMDTNYVFWDIEPTGYWDDMWNKYKPLFDALGTYSAMDTGQVAIAQTYIKEMVTPLKDGHFAVDFEDGPGYYPSQARVEGRYNSAVTPDADPNADPKTIFHFWVPMAENTLRTGFDACNGDDWLWAQAGTGSNALQMATGIIPASGGHIRYLYFSQFIMSVYINNDAGVTAVMNAYWNDLLTEDCKGIIFDMRGNGGGNVVDKSLILSPLLASDLHYVNLRLKKSSGRLDYTSWIPDTLKANPSGSRYRAINAGKLPVVALINDYSVSAGEAMPQAVKVMPGGHLIGTKTWGATGPRNGNESPSISHGGSFTHNKLWTKVTQAGWQSRGLQFQNYEGEGVPPDDEPVKFDLLKFNAGDDVQLKAAIDYVSSE